MSKDMVFEDVPRLMRRTGDMLVAGANNSAILLGRDRVTGVDTGYGSSEAAGGGRDAGSVHLSVGRLSEDPSVRDDRATIYVSAKTDVDAVADTQSIGRSDRAVSGVIMRADCVRITSRMDFKISVGKAYITLDSSGAVVVEGDVSLGQDAAQRIIRGDAFSKFWSTVTVPTPMGPSGPPPPLPDDVFSSRNRVK